MRFKTKKYVVWSLCLIVFVSSCSSPDTKNEAQKILDKQVDVLEKEQKSTEALYTRVKDSLLKQESLLSAKKIVVEKKISEFEETKKNDQISDLKAEKDKLNSELNAIVDSMGMLKEELTKLENQSSELEVKGEMLKEQKEEAESSMHTGIEEIDQRLDKIENQKITKQQEININKKKVDLANQKIDLLKDEKNIYEREKNDLALQGGSEVELQKFEDKLSEIENELLDEKDKIDRASKVVSANNQWLKEFMALKSSLKDMMAKEYNKKETIDSFAIKETKRLNNELTQLQKEKKELENSQENLNNQKGKIDDKLASIDNEIAIVRSSDLSDLLQRKSQLGEAEALLSEQESQFEPSFDSLNFLTSDITTESNVSILEDLEKDLKQQRDEIQTIKAQISAERKELAQKQAKIDAQRAQNAEAIKMIGILIVVAILVFMILFYLGKRKRLNKA